MSFDVTADAYGLFMGRYSEPLAARFADWAGVQAGDRALDVGCGPGALSAALIERLGVASVSAVDPSPTFLASIRARFPALDVQQATAEDLPFPDGRFEHAMAQLVVHFMRDPVAGLSEMARVTGPGGRVSACVWDLAGDRGPISPLWRAARQLDPGVDDESLLPGVGSGDLVRLAEAAGLADVESAELAVTVRHPTFEQWWEPYLLGVGPAGSYVASLDDGAREALRSGCRDLFPEPPFDVTAVAWAVRGRA